MTRIAPLAAILLLFGAADAHAVCRGYLQSARLAIGAQVEALNAVEAKVLHRLMGGREPAYEKLARDARTLAAALYTDTAAIAEHRTRRCRNWVPPVRRTCRDAALRLAVLIDESSNHRLSEQTRMQYADLISRCERWLAMPRRRSFLRMP